MISVWFLIKFSVSLKYFFKELQKWFLTNRKIWSYLDQDELLLEEWYSWTFPHSRVHVEVFHFVHRSSIRSLSHNRTDFVHVRHDCRQYVKTYVAIPYFSFRIPWIFCNTGSRRFPRAVFVCNRLTCFFILVNAPGSDSENSIMLDSPLLRQVFLLLCPSSRPGTHLAASLENSALRQVSNFFSSCLPFSPQLWVSPDLRM